MAQNVFSTCSPIGIGCILYTDITLTTPVADGIYSDGVNVYTVTGGSGSVFSLDSCSSFTTTTSTTSTTTILYDVYLADRYDCATCTLVASGVLMALPQGTTPVTNDFYLPSAGSGEQGTYVYKLLSPSSGAGLICDDVHTNACATTCSIIA